MEEGDWKILRWMANHRRTTGLVTLAVFAYGLFGCWPSITAELPRFDRWHRWLLWTGDLAALLAVVVWTIRKPPDEASDYTRAVKRATIAIMVAISFDIAVTVYGLESERRSWLGSTAAVATVTKTSTRVVQLAQPKRYYVIDFEFPDLAGNSHPGRLEFSQFGDDEMPNWKKILLAAVENNRKKIDIVYDPERPARVWAKEQAWGHGARLGMICMCIHIFQITMLGGFVYHVLVQRNREAFSPEISEVTSVLPLVVEAITLAIIGSAALWMGSLA